jgi:hypothetical protein
MDRGEECIRFARIGKVELPKSPAWIWVGEDHTVLFFIRVSNERMH